MTVQQKWRTWAAGAAITVLAACATSLGTRGFFGEVPLPAGPLDRLTSGTMRGLQSQVTWVGCSTVQRTGNNSGTTTNVEICAAQYARDIGQGNTNSNGVLMARMVNLGSQAERRWGLTPGDTSFIVSFPRDQTQGSYAILQVRAGSSGGTNVNVLRQNGNFIYCDHPKPASSSASFHTCQEKRPAPARSTRGQTGSGPNAPDEVANPSEDGPAWVSCLSGCCTTEAV